LLHHCRAIALLFMIFIVLGAFMMLNLVIGECGH
jgi:hypothetical protein